MLNALQPEGAYHLQDILFDRGIRSLTQLASMSVEHVRALPCSNIDKTVLLNASRSARLSVAADDEAPLGGRAATGEGFGDADVALLLTSRGAGGFDPLFQHRIEKVTQHAAAEGDVAEDETPCNGDLFPRGPVDQNVDNDCDGRSWQKVRFSAICN